jgi:hypothetical protein
MVETRNPRLCSMIRRMAAITDPYSDTTGGMI